MPAKFKWTVKVVDELCAHVAGGMSIKKACKQPGMPSEPTIYRHLAEDVKFAERMAKARADQQEFEVDACVDMADKATAKNWQQVRLRIWARQWRAAKLAPKKYGDKQHIEHSGQIDLAAGLIAARKRSGITG